VLLVNPDPIYDDLLTPSLFALWLSELVVYGLWTTIQTTSI